MAIIYGNAISIGYATSGSSVGGTYSIWLTLPAVAASTTFTAVKDGVSVESKYISSIKAAKITLPADKPEGDWTITGTVGGKTVSKTVNVKSGTVDYFIDFRNDFIPLVGNLAVGNLVTFDNKEWRVVHQEGTHWYLGYTEINNLTIYGKTTAFTKATIFESATAFKNTFSAQALEYIVDVNIEDTPCTVWIPSEDELNGGFSYFTGTNSELSDKRKRKFGTSGNMSWWTRSNRSAGGFYKRYVTSTGDISETSNLDTTKYGFVPFICIKYYPIGFDFTYTGTCNIRTDGVIEFLTSGDFIPNETLNIDAFLVGGGGAGNGAGSSGAAAGGGGGYTKTLTKIILQQGTSYPITIGAGGAHSTTSTSYFGLGGGNTTAFGTTVNGGQPTTSTGAGGNGGSGGGGTTKQGGSDGSNGLSSGAYIGGKGQGTTTREFGEPTGKLYAAGGGGGISDNTTIGIAGGDGGGGMGGTSAVNGHDGEANTGSGGGGKGSNRNLYAGSGGSGIVCIRLHKETSPTTIPLTGDLAVGNTVTFDDKSFVVVHNEVTQWYLAKEYITDQTTFSSKTPALYNGSKVASMCNTYLTQFSDNAKKYMVDVTVEGVTNKVFVPTHAQVNGGFSWYNSNANRTVKRDTDKVTMSWWTSTSYNNSNLLYAIEGGQSLSTGSILTKTYDHTLGVRPHICIDTSLSGSATEETVLNGTYLFNANPTAPAKYPFTETVPYKYGSSSSGIYQSIRFYQDTNTKNLCMYYHYSDTSATAVYNFTTKKWLNDTYKTIIFDNQTVSKEFYTWFTANATKQS